MLVSCAVCVVLVRDHVMGPAFSVVMGAGLAIDYQVPRRLCMMQECLLFCKNRKQVHNNTMKRYTVLYRWPR